jgi:hypothetical protein
MQLFMVTIQDLSSKLGDRMKQYKDHSEKNTELGVLGCRCVQGVTKNREIFRVSP